MGPLSESSSAYEAASAGQFALAIRLILDEMQGGAIEVLGETPEYQQMWRDLYLTAAADSPGLDPMAFVDWMLERDWDGLALSAKAALDYVQARPWPGAGEEWPRELVAAWVLLDVFAMASKARGLRRKLVGRDTLDLVGVAELVWIALRIGALSEAMTPGFRPSAGAFGSLGESADAAAQALEARETGLKNAKEKVIAKADLWRIPALDIARDRRAANRAVGDERLAEVVLPVLAARPDVKRVPALATMRKQIRNWVQTGNLDPSIKRPPAKGGKP